MNVTDQLIQPPKSTRQTEVEQLAYVESFDAVVDRDYAYVVYKETRTDTGKWVVRIKGSGTAGAVFDPAASAFRSALRKAAGHDEPYMLWGYSHQPRENDPRLVENRVLIDGDGTPSALEVRLVTRKADGSARDEKMVTVPWPE